MISEEAIKLDEEEYGAYYARLQAASFRAGEAVKTHETVRLTVVSVSCGHCATC